MKFHFIFLLCIGMMAPGIALAQKATPKVTKKQVQQQARIKEGVKSGQITPREKAKLEAQAVKLQHDKKLAKADGVVTPAERARLNREAKRNSKAIYKEKHDAQHR